MGLKNGQYETHWGKKYFWQQTQHLSKFSSAKEPDMLGVARELQPVSKEVAIAHGLG